MSADELRRRLAAERVNSKNATPPEQLARRLAEENAMSAEELRGRLAEERLAELDRQPENPVWAQLRTEAAELEAKLALLRDLPSSSSAGYDVKLAQLRLLDPDMVETILGGREAAVREAEESREQFKRQIIRQKDFVGNIGTAIAVIILIIGAIALIEACLKAWMRSA